MNKLFSKIASLSVGLAMAAGVGLALGHNSFLKVLAVDPLELDYTSSYEGLKTKDNTVANELYQTPSSFNANYTFNCINVYSGSGYIMLGSKQKNGVAMFSNSTAMPDFISSISITKGTNSSTSANYYVKTSDSEITSNTVNWDAQSTGKGAYQYSVDSSLNHKYFAIYTDTAANGQVSTITIRFKSSSAEVPVTGVTLNKTSTTIAEGGNETLTATVAPDNATNKNVTWSTSDDKVATVDSNGKVSAVGAGTATITVTTLDGSKTATCNVTVTAASSVDPVVTDTSVTWDTSKKSYSSASATQVSWTSTIVDVVVDKGEASTDTNSYLPPVRTSSRVYKDSTVTITPKTGYSISSISFACTSENYANVFASETTTYTNASASVSSQTATITPADGGTAVAITVGGTSGFTSIVVDYTSSSSEKTVESIALSGTITKTAYGVGETPSAAGLVVTATYDDETTGVVTAASTITPTPATLALTDTSVSFTATYKGKTSNTLNFDVTVSAQKGSLGNPFTVAEARAFIDAGSGLTETYYVAGKFVKTTTAVDKIDGFKNADLWFSDNGADSNCIEAYRCKYINGADMKASYLPDVGDTVVLKGKLKKYNTTYELDQGCEIVSITPAPINEYSLEEVYDLSDGTKLVTAGVYMGKVSDGYYIMDGKFGMFIYQGSGQGAEPTGAVVGESIISVTGSRASYKNLVQVKPTSAEIITESDVSEPEIYGFTGEETYTDVKLLNRRTHISGVISSIGSYTKDSSDVEITAGSSDITITINGTPIHYKKADQTQTIVDELITNLLGQKSTTISAFTGVYEEAFQLRLFGIVETKEDYTAVMFAQDLLDQTDALCVTYVDGESSYESFRTAFVAIWSDLNSDEKYNALPADQKLILGEADRNEEGTVVEQAMARYDFLTGKYNLSNFISGRTPVSFAQNIFVLNNQSGEFAVVMTIFATMTVTSFGLFFMLRKRKEK